MSTILPLLFSFSDVLEGWAVALYDGIFGTEAMNQVFDMISFGSADGSLNYNSFWAQINSLLAVVKPFGYALITTYFLMSLLDSAAKDNVTMDNLIKVFIQLILVVAVIGNLEVIINALLKLNETLLSSFAGYAPSGESNTMDGQDYVDAIVEANQEGYGKSGWFGIFMEGIILWLIHWVAIIGCLFAAITRAIDIGWRCVLAPIGVANCFEGGISSPGVRYMKNLAASILSGAALYAVLAVGMSLSASAMAGTIENPDNSKTLIACAILLATAGAGIGVNAKAKDIVG